MPSVLVAMSGGVDSSVTAFLLREQGYDCIGATMRLWDDPERPSTCCSIDDVEDARSVCRRLDIPHYTFDMTSEFAEAVIGRFARSYEAGLTPNPCIDCNRFMKFDLLLHRARELGCDYIATGHYAKIGKDAGRKTLSKACDLTKDQSYVLYALTQDQLAHTLLPLGGLAKTEVREIAEHQGFRNAHKSESQDICFVPDGDYLDFLQRWRGSDFEPGDIETLDGTVVGRHRGAAGYTLGQRKGLGVALREPMYVCAKDMARNTVTLGPAEALMRRRCEVEDWNWVCEPPTSTVRGAAKTHYRHREQPATATPLPSGGVLLEFDAPQRAMTPGQAAVLYAGDTVLGGGTIAAVLEE